VLVGPGRRADLRPGTDHRGGAKTIDRGSGLAVYQCLACASGGSLTGRQTSRVALSRCRGIGRAVAECRGRHRARRARFAQGHLS
jgi:hypothetical protein